MFLQQLCRLNPERCNWTSSPTLVHQPLTSALLAKAKQLVGIQLTQDATPMEVHPKVRNPKVPLRNWRVILDKIAVILVLAAVQDADSHEQMRLISAGDPVTS